MYKTNNKSLLYSTGNFTLWWSKWEENLKQRDICVSTAESLCCTAETNTTLKSNYMPIIFFLIFDILWQNQCRVRSCFTDIYLKPAFLVLFHSVQFNCSVMSDSLRPHELLAARQASLSIINSQSSLRLTSIESVMPSSHLILCHPLLLLPPILPSIRDFSNESTLHMRWPKY